MIQTSSHRFLIATIIPRDVSDEVALYELQEVKSLIETFGGKVIDLVAQRREVHDKGMYLGSGKFQEAAEIIRREHIDVVVLNAVVKPGQLLEIKNIFLEANPHIEVWDRVDLILHIFLKHANTAEAKLQIRLAQMRHMGPRIYGMGYVMSRQGGGIGTLGVGETNTELMKRHWRDQIKKVEDELKKLAQTREKQLDRRRKTGFQTVSVIGYTNAGKTSLFNSLSGKKKIAANALFATLDSSVAKIYLQLTKKEILISDTIGFIQHLPTSLIQAFKSTLMEVVHADLLLHVIDASDSHYKEKILTVETILKELSIEKTPTIYVFNKIDLLTAEQIEKMKKEYSDYPTVFISVKQAVNLSVVQNIIEEQLPQI